MFRLTLLSIVCICASIANAQNNHYGEHRYRAGGYGYRLHHVPVYRGHYLHGVADVVRAHGERNLLNSAAAINLRHAESLQMDNHVKHVETHFERRRIRDAYKNRSKVPMTMDKARRIAAARRPARLGPHKLNLHTGEVAWPQVFTQPPFRQHGAEIERLLRQNVSTGGLHPEASAKILQLCQRLEDTLSAQLDQLEIQDASRAKAFLTSFLYEIKLASS